MKPNKKGQVGYFIIVGLVILIIAGFIVLIMTTTVKKETEKEVERVEEQAFSTKVVENYVSECLRKTAENALILLGRQGGVIYTLQGGTMYGPFFEGERYVKYDYEGDGENQENDCLVHPDQINPSLELCKIRHGIIIPGVNSLPSMTQGLDAMDRALESYIQEELRYFNQVCKIEDILLEQGFKIQLGFSEPSVEFVIGTNDVIVKLDYPMDVEERSSGKKEKLQYFSANLNVRLNYVYRYTSNLIEHMINPMRQHPDNDPYFDDKISDNEIDSLPNLPISNKIIRVIDEGSTIKGRPYSFYFVSSI